MSGPDNLLTEWSRLFVGSLARAGVKHLIISPGSRSTSLVTAAIAEPELTCHSVLDERSAGFVALGIARATGVPPAVVCTSGSAAAHYLPALVEATHAELPIIVVSANRPCHLQDASSPQTITQPGIFAHHVKRCFDLGDPAPTDAAFRHLARKAHQAFLLATSGRPGPIHLDFPAAKPLEPTLPVTPGGNHLRALVDTLLASPRDTPIPGGPRYAAPQLRASDDIVQRVIQAFAKTPNALISVGPVPTKTARLASRLAEELDCFCLCEQPGLATPVEGIARGLSGAGATALPAPDLVLHIGSPSISSAWQGVLEETSATRVFLAAAEHPDPTATADLIVTGALDNTLERLIESAQRFPPDQERSRFTATFLRAQESLHDAIERETALAEYRRSIPPGRPAPLPEPAVVKRILTTLPETANLCLGNSLPVRIAAWVSPIVSTAPRQVYYQRGAAGIDGLIAGAAGVALASSRPTVLLLGDVSAAHDLSSLAVARTVRTPLVICVLDNGGGHIFDHLPLAESIGRKPEFRMWTTPPELDWEAAARTYGVAYKSPLTADGIAPALQAALDRPGTTLVALHVHPQSSRDFLHALGAGPRPSGGLN